MNLFGGRGKKITTEQQAEVTRLMTLINQNSQEETQMGKTAEQAAVAKEKVVTPAPTIQEAVSTVVATQGTGAGLAGAPVSEAALPGSTLTPAQAAAATVTVQKTPTKSDVIRALYTQGISVAEIAKATSSHYSFVYGVCRALKGSSPSEDRGPSRSDEIRVLADAGHTPGEIAKALNANYSFVHSVVKKHKEDTAAPAQQ